jgi:hypothetical protein
MSEASSFCERGAVASAVSLNVSQLVGWVADELRESRMCSRARPPFL